MKKILKFSEALRRITWSPELDFDKVYDLVYFKLMFSSKDIMQKCIEPLLDLSAEILVDIKEHDKDNVVWLRISIRCEFINYETIMSSHDYEYYFNIN